MSRDDQQEAQEQDARVDRQPRIDRRPTAASHGAAPAPKKRNTAPKFSCPMCRSRLSHVIPHKAKCYGTTTDDAGREIYRRLRACNDCGTAYSTTEGVERIVRRQERAA